MQDLKDKILDCVLDKHKRSGGKCGIRPIDVCRQLRVKYQDIAPFLNEMDADGSICVRPGVNGWLLFMPK